MKYRILQAAMAACLALACCLPALAGVVIDGTRVIYPSSAREVTVQLSNTGGSPALVQAWIDRGDPDQAPEDSDAPFVLTPPITRIEPGRGQALRIIATGEEFPQDRESVFWLNVLEVPPAPDADSAENYLQVAFRSRIKLFFRPPGLEGTANAAPAGLQWQRRGARLHVSNPTDWHVTIARVTALDANGAELGVVEENGQMLPPGGTAEWNAPGTVADVAFTTVNDYGGRAEHKAGVAR